MFIILPNKVDGLPDLETKISENINIILDKIAEIMIERLVTVHIPKLKIKSTRTTTKEYLVELGIKDFFSENLADLPGIYNGQNKDLYCSEVFHKCFIEINEKGTEETAGVNIIWFLNFRRTFNKFDFVIFLCWLTNFSSNIRQWFHDEK